MARIGHRFAAACVLALAGAGSAHTAARPVEVEASEVALLVARKTSDFRTANSLDGLAANRALSDAAQRFAEFMARSDQYGHDADGRKPADRARAHGYDYCVIAENIAYRFSSSGFSTDQLAAQLVDGWERSPGHRQNMLLPNVVDLGVGIARSAQSQRWYAVQLFGRPKSASSRFEIVNPTGVTLRYELDAQRFELPGGVTRSHQGCFGGALKVVSPEAAPDAGVAPRDGARYTVQRSASGQLWLQASPR